MSTRSLTRWVLEQLKLRHRSNELDEQIDVAKRILEHRREINRDKRKTQNREAASIAHQIKPLPFPIDPKSGKILYKQALSKKHEDFVRAFLQTGDAAEAYKRAFNTSSRARQRGDKLLESMHIQARLDQFRGALKKIMAWDINKVLTGFEEIYHEAKDNGDYTNANRSLEQVGKHLGMFVERIEHKQLVKHLSDGKNIDDEIKELANVVGMRVIEGGKSNG